MGSITRLSESIRSSIRSGVILYDFTRIVEELVFNSLDAHATKVSVALGVGTCYVKVDDNGPGIARDGLALIGERYVTSKYSHLDDMHAFPTSFGFKGEALNSISGISLLEIITKAHGRPNGYRKVLKDSKCLYLGIDDDRQDVGTTVIVRDLFYNQPVRRNQMHSNPKRILHSLKECLLRIALVHPSVSFKIFDIESEDDMLCTSASPSPLLLLSSGFGVHSSRSLNKLNASDGSLKLSGYISGPQYVNAAKVLQYFYINSRFVSKGPIHKLLNNLARSFDSASEIEKQSRSQICPLFLLNLNCPRAFYDLTLEPSKTSVEFKDWRSILFFIEDAVRNLWTESNSAGMPVNEIRKKRRRSQGCKASVELSSPQPEKLTGECSVGIGIQSLPQEILWGNASEKHDPGSRFLCQSESSNWSIDGSLAPYTVAVNRKSGSLLQPSSSNVFDTGDDFWDNKFYVSSSSVCKSDSMLSSGWEDEFPTVVTGRSTDIASSRESVELDDSLNVMRDRRKSFLQSCSLHRSLLCDGASHRGNEICFGPFSECKTQGNVLQRSNFWSRDPEKSSLTSDILDEDNHPFDFVKQTEEYGSSLLSFSSDLCPPLSDPFLGSRFQDIDPFIAEDGIETSIKHEVGVMYNFENMEHTLLVPAIHKLGEEDCLFPKSAKFSSDVNFYASGVDMSSIVGHDPQVSYSSGPEFYYDGDDLSHTHSHGEERLNNYSTPRAMLSSRVDGDSHKRIVAGNQCKKKKLIRKSRRSHSAPPLYQGKKKLFSMSDSSRKEAGNTNLMTVHDVPLVPEARAARKLQHSAEAICWELPQQSSHDQFSIPGCGDGVSSDNRLNVEKKPVINWNGKFQTQGECPSTHDLESKEELACLTMLCKYSEFASTKPQNFLDSGSKWRNYCSETTVRSSNGVEDPKNQDTILDVTSGILHFVGDSLVPDTIDRNCLEGAKVLQQVDKKYIPIVAGTTLAIIDQHAADERIRLEELREKVLSGQMRTTSYLDTEQELVIPEIAYQLIHNYAEQIQNWGWMCNINSQASKSFTRNLNLINKQRAAVTLLAVPCILGVNLTDMDLLEFLQQLADTDGSSIIPPSVNRVLNSKACRSAIMFGDALLPSECSLIVEELKQTSLCFQCAHGRPTTVPLVNLDALHEQISKVGSWSRGSSEAWHGLHRNEISLERAAKRLRLAVS